MMSIVVSILTAPINLLIDYFFVDILSAPSVDETKMRRVNDLKESHFGRILKNVGDIARRASTVTADAVRVTGRRFGVGGHVSLQIPETTKEAHDLARDSSQQIIQERRVMLERERSSRGINRSQSLARRHPKEKNRGTQYYISQGQNFEKAGDSDHLNSDALTTLFSELMVDLNDQRYLLKPSLRERYDAQWG